MLCSIAMTEIISLRGQRGKACRVTERTCRPTTYVLLETSALLQHRLGLAALRTFNEDVAPLVRIDWIAEGRHGAAAGAVLAAGPKN